MLDYRRIAGAPEFITSSRLTLTPPSRCIRSARAAERTIDGLWAAIGRIVSTFAPTECANYFAACGYDPDW